MKRNRFLGILVAILVMWSALPYSAQAFTSDEIIRVGYYTEDDLVSSIGSVGNEGYGYDVLRKIEEVSNLNFELLEVELVKIYTRININIENNIIRVGEA